jgi:yeast amino acid transporter
MVPISLLLYGSFLARLEDLPLTSFTKANIFLVFFQGFTTLVPFSGTDFVVSPPFHPSSAVANPPVTQVSYIVIPVFLILLIGWKLYHKTRFVRLEEMDLDSDRRQVERERYEQGIIEQEDEVQEYDTKNWWGKMKAWGAAVVA